MKIIPNPIFNEIKSLQALSEIYDELEEKITVFKKKGAIECIAGCGQCCETSHENIETTLLEMLPAALYFWKNNQAEALLEKLNRSEKDDCCVLYQPVDPENGKGFCTLYEYRGLVCRLFGFSARVSKDRKTVFQPCMKIKQNLSYLKEKINILIQAGLTVPVFSNYGQQVSSLDPVLSSKVYGINEALKKALEWVGLRLSFALQKPEEEDKNKRPPIVPSGKIA